MMRASLFRLSPLLALALLLGALGLFAAAPVQAQTTVWSGTLTADQSGTIFGCSNAAATLDNCSSSTVLTEDEFTHGGATYTVWEIFWRSDTDRLGFRVNSSAAQGGTINGQTIKTELSSLTLNVDGTALAISDAVASTSSINWSYNPATDWTDGRTVSLSLTSSDTPPADPTNRDDRPATSWKGYSLTLSADIVPSEKGADVTVTLDLGKAAAPGFYATIEGLPAGTAEYGIGGRAPAEKRAEVRSGRDWTMLGKVQMAGSGGLRPASSQEIARGAERGVVAGSGGVGRLQQHLRDWNGARTKTVRLRIIDDPWVDPGETIVLRAIGSNVSSDGKTPWTTGFGFSELHSNTLTLTIVDDDSADAADAPLEVGVLDALTYETGTGAATNAPVTVWLNRPASHDVTVNYATADVTAKSTGTKDYTSKSGTLTIPAGETRAEVTVEVLDDAVEDSGETFRLVLSNPSPSSVRLARAQATVTIRNDELRLDDLKVQGGPDAKGPWSELDIGEFSPDTTNYAVTAPYETTHAQLRATPMDERAATLATGSGSDPASVRAGRWGEAVALEVGDNTLVMVASGSAGDVKTYRVTVTRQAWAPSSNADLRWLLVQGASNGAGPWTKLDFAFDPDTTEYAVTAPLGTTVARVMATPEYDANGEVRATLRTGAGTELKAARPGFWSQGYALAAGGNAFAVEVTAEDGTTKTYTVTVTLPTNDAPTVASGIADATIVNESGTRGIPLSGVFSDPDGDALTVTASSSDENTATVSVSVDYSTLTVTAQGRGTATITVTASDGKGGEASDTFTVTVKAAPVVASPIADISGLEAEDSRTISMSEVFSDADGDAVTVIEASSSDSAIAAVSVAIDGSTSAITAITVIAKSEGAATITVTAEDADGNRVSDAFDVSVAEAEAEQQQQQQQQAVELPGAVTSLDLTASAEDSVTVSWSASETGGAPRGYIVHLRPEGGGEGSGATKRPGANKTTVSFNNLESGRTYRVWVRAENEAGKGERVPATIALPAALPGPVTGLEATATADGVTVRWSAPETGGAPDGYIVHVRPEDGAAGSGRTKTPKAKRTSVTFENLEAGRTYEVWARAQNEAGKGERVHATVTLPEAEPPPDQGEPGDGQQQDGQSGQ